MKKRKILFVCPRNTGRSLMAAAVFNQMCQERYEAQSASLELGEVHPVVEEVLAERCLDVSDHHAQNLFAVIKSEQVFTHVITLCDETTDERAPIYVGVTERRNWSLPAPENLKGTRQAKRAVLRAMRQEIEQRIETEFGHALERELEPAF